MGHSVFDARLTQAFNAAGLRTELAAELDPVLRYELGTLAMTSAYFRYYEQIGEPKKALRTFEKAFGMQEIDFLTKDMALDKMDALKADFGF